MLIPKGQMFWRVWTGGKVASPRGVKQVPAFPLLLEEENLSIATGTGTNLTVEEVSDAVDLGSPGRTPLSPPTVTPGKLSS